MRPAATLAAGPRVYLRRPLAGDGAGFLAAVRASRGLHRGRVRPPRTPAEYERYLARARHGALLHLICRRSDDALIGVCNLTDLVRGSMQSASLGYYGFAAHVGQGYMGEGLALVLHQAFVRARLHRVEASIQPANAASIALVGRAGFRREGLSPRLLKVGGRWRDHVRYALLADEWRAGRAAGRRAARVRRR